MLVPAARFPGRGAPHRWGSRDPPPIACSVAETGGRTNQGILGWKFSANLQAMQQPIYYVGINCGTGSLQQMPTNFHRRPSPTELSISALSHLLVLSRVMSRLLLLGTVIWCLSAVATATSTDSPGCGGGSLLALAPVGRESQRHCVCPPSTTCKPGMGRGGGSREAGGCSTGHDSAWEAASGCESARGRIAYDATDHKDHIC